MPFIFEPTVIPEVILIKPRIFSDARGCFLETYKRSDFEKAGIHEHFVQDNFSHSTCNVVRGLHYQKNPRAQGKLVSVMRGRIFDVAVDLRRKAPTYGKFVGVELSSENRWMLYIPEGFAHGFCVLSADVDVAYKATSEYAPEQERGVLWNDPEIGIPWPVKTPVLSLVDQKYPPLRDADHDFIHARRL